MIAATIASSGTFGSIFGTTIIVLLLAASTSFKTAQGLPLQIITTVSAKAAGTTIPSSYINHHSNHNDSWQIDSSQPHHNSARRRLLFEGTALSWILMTEPVLAARRPFSRRDPLLQTQQQNTMTRNDTAETTETTTATPVTILSSERCLLELLPIKNPYFLTLVGYVQRLPVLSTTTTTSTTTSSTTTTTADTWRTAHRVMTVALDYLDHHRRLLEPTFDQEESTDMQIRKGERGERLAEQLREELVALVEATDLGNTTEQQLNQQQQIGQLQKKALLALSDIGELLVGPFPYSVPTQGKFANLPRLLGRARVTFTFQRGTERLGNVTIIADGFAAPITAGNFVDLALRNFYTGLPMKVVKKKLGGPTTVRTGLFGLEAYEWDPDLTSSTVIASLPILGSYREGFFDPLTAKLRKIPLEILRVDNSIGGSKLSYAKGFSDGSAEEEYSDNIAKQSKPLLSFDIPGLVAMSHPDKLVNGGSSEFFSLQTSTLESDKERTLLDGQYAPFGFIIDGFDLFQSLKANDIIEATTVTEWGQSNLVKIKGNSFSDVLGGLDEESPT
jgi:cyclophilin family peptidyl-prolyl cis-trans isomerase